MAPGDARPGGRVTAVGTRPLRAMSLAALLALGAPRPSRAQDLLPLVGGGAGNSFSLVCPTGAVLTGVRARREQVLRAIGPRCRPVRADGTLGDETDAGPVWGGPGGVAYARSCDEDAVVAQQTAGFDGARLSHLAYQCFRWLPAARRWDPAGPGSALVVLQERAPPAPRSVSRCPAAARPADGIRGRSGMLVESVGLRCDGP